MTADTKEGFEGWRIFWTAAALLLALTIVILASAPDADGLRMTIRTTARTSLFLFLLAFVASGAARLWPSSVTRWLRRNRRQLGLSFAMSHVIHLGAVVMLAQTDPALFWTQSNPGSIAAGSLGYVAIALLAATSFDRMVSRLGAARWRRLHAVGVWIIWLSFLVANGKRIPVSGWYAVPVSLALAALLVRVSPRWFSQQNGAKERDLKFG